MGESECKRLSVERYVSGELTGEIARAVETHLKTCAACGARCADLQKERDEFLRLHPFAELRALGAMGNSGELWYERFMKVFAFPVLRPMLIPLCMLLLVGVIIIPFTGKTGLFDAGNLSTIRYKGTAQPLSYIYKRGDQVRESSPADTFMAGDKIQLFYDSRKEQYLTLFSISGTGSVSFYHPEARALRCSIRTGVGSRLAYPASIELDETPGAEFVVALFSEQPFDTNQIKKWVAGFEGTGPADQEKTMKARPPHENCSVATLVINKR
jgi:hypothetical protein